MASKWLENGMVYGIGYMGLPHDPHRDIRNHDAASSEHPNAQTLKMVLSSFEQPISPISTAKTIAFPLHSHCIPIAFRLLHLRIGVHVDIGSALIQKNNSLMGHQNTRDANQLNSSSRKVGTFPES